MTAEAINLRRVRKAKRREARADEAALNRALHGQSAVEREAARHQAARADRRLDGHLLASADRDDPSA